MNLLTKIMWQVLVVIVAIKSPSLAAHELKATTAQVVVREGHVEVRVYTNTAHLISALKNEHAWLMGDIDELMPANLNADALKRYIKKALSEKIALNINAQLIPFESVEINHIRDSDVHDLEVVFQATHALSAVDTLKLSFPSVLGTVHANFVKPSYRLIAPGDEAFITF